MFVIIVKIYQIRTKRVQSDCILRPTSNSENLWYPSNCLIEPTQFSSLGHVAMKMVQY